MRIVIETVDHKDQRYDTVGDWQEKPYWAGEFMDKTTVCTTLVIRVSRMKDWRSEVLVAVHELVEAMLCQHAGITAEQVDVFDMNWPPSDAKGRLDRQGFDEPGDDPLAPYHQQHLWAMEIERQLCRAFCMSWKMHEANVDALSEPEIAGYLGRLEIVRRNYSDRADHKPYLCFAPELSATVPGGHGDSAAEAMKDFHEKYKKYQLEKLRGHS